MELPVELFGLFTGTSIALALFGFIRNPQIPAMMVFGGIFILFIAVSTDTIILDHFYDGLSGDIIDAGFEFTDLPKTVFALMGVIFMLSGALMVMREQG